METHAERLEREKRHLQKKLKKNSVHKKNKIKHMLTEEENKNWKRKIFDEE